MFLDCFEPDATCGRLPAVESMSRILDGEVADIGQRGFGIWMLCRSRILRVVLIHAEKA
jgi:hypothetical protein